MHCELTEIDLHKKPLVLIKGACFKDIFKPQSYYVNVSETQQVGEKHNSSNALR